MPRECGASSNHKAGDSNNRRRLLDHPPSRMMTNESECARQSWRDPAGASPVQVRSSVRLVASVAWPLATVVAKRTQRLHGVWGLSHERLDIAGAESLYSLEGNMCGTIMRGADALPGSKATSRAKGSRRNLGGLGSGRQMLCERNGPHREGEEPKPMMHGHEKSDLAIVAVKRRKPTAEISAGADAAESVERRAGAKGNTHQQSTYWTQEPGSRVKGAGACTATIAVIHPRWEPYAGKPHVRFWAGGVR